MYCATAVLGSRSAHAGCGSRRYGVCGTAYTTVQTLVYRLEQKGAVRRVKRLGNAQLFEPAIDQTQFRSGLVRDLLDLFGGSPRLLVSNLLETGTLTLKDLKAVQAELPQRRVRRRDGDRHA